jgi:hypothetical protein
MDVAVLGCKEMRLRTTGLGIIHSDLYRFSEGEGGLAKYSVVQGLIVAIMAQLGPRERL